MGRILIYALTGVGKPMVNEQQNSQNYLASIEKYKAEIENYKAQLKQEEIRLNRWAAAFRETVNLAVVSIRSLILINGGAIIALLAFLGNLAGKGEKIHYIDAKCPLILYSLGLGLSVFIALLAYVFHVIEFEVKPESFWKKTAKPVRFTACLMGLLGLGFFVWGAFASLKILSSIH